MKVYNKEEFEEFIMNYLRDSLKDKNYYIDANEDINDRFKIFLKVLNSRGILSFLIKNSYKDNFSISTHTKQIRNKIQNNKNITLS